MRITSALHWALLVALLASPVVASTQNSTDDQEPVALHNPVISADGAWMAAEERPGQGDGKVRVWSTKRDLTFTIERGQNPRISRDSRWVSALQKPLLEDASAGRPKNKRAGQTLVLLDTQDSSRRTFDFVQSYHMTSSSSHLIYLQSQETKADKEAALKDKATKQVSRPGAKARRMETLHVVLLESDSVMITQENVTQLATHQTMDYVAYVLHNEETGHDRLHIAGLGPGTWGMNGIYDGEKIDGLCWARDQRTLGFLDSTKTTSNDGKLRVNSSLYMWQRDIANPSLRRTFTRVDTAQ